MNDNSNEQVEDEDMTHNHVSDEVEDNARIVVDFWLQVDSSTIYGLVHDADPALIGHEDHQIENTEQQVVKVGLSVLP